MARQTITIRRVYDDPAKGGGARFLVDRIWPRGIKKEDLHLDGWLKDVAPTDDLRHWFGHDVARWMEFRRRYQAELESNPSAWQPILDAAQKGSVTLLFGARDEEHNQAVVLRDFVARKLKHHQEAGQSSQRPATVSGRTRLTRSRPTIKIS
jgi:uncharacterized protein YeaO (DUF488 family)